MSWLFSNNIPESHWTRECSSSKLERDFEKLSHAFTLAIGDDNEYVIVQDVKLPEGYNKTYTDMLIEIPSDYPSSPPGVGGSQVYVSPDLRYQNRKIQDIHTYEKPSFPTPRFGPWAWWCYADIRWDPKRDDLIRFVEMVRADMTNPPTK